VIDRTPLGRPVHTILRLPDVKYRTGLSRSTLYQRISDGTFPKAIGLGGRAVGWLDSEIEEWISRRVKWTRGAATASAEQVIP
jgi:prophage regulatory protein